MLIFIIFFSFTNNSCGRSVVLCDDKCRICWWCFKEPNDGKMKCYECGIEYQSYITGKNKNIYAKGPKNNTKCRKTPYMRKCVEAGCFQYVCYNCNDWEGSKLLDCGNHDTDNGVCVSCKTSFARDEMINDGINDSQKGLVCVECDSVNDIHRFNNIEFV